jgi:hypothetical protein
VGPLNDTIGPNQHVAGMVNRICFAFFKLIASSNFFGCSISNSAGFAPSKISSTYQKAEGQ